jgi:SAM-dependent methyltransferase
MSPLPSLSLHFQTNSEKDPYIDWETWWNKHGDDTVKHREQDLFQSDKKIVLNVGCGKTKLEYQSKHFTDWKEIRIDGYENNTADIIDSMVGLEKVPNQSVDAIWASHVVEHNYWHDLPKVFSSFMRVLKEDGFAVIRVPDLGSIAPLIEDNLLEVLYDTDGAGPVSVIDMIYGHRGFTESWGEGMAHKTGFTKKSMEQLLSSFDIKGFVKSENREVIAIIFKNEPPLEAMADEGLIL